MFEVINRAVLESIKLPTRFLNKLERDLEYIFKSKINSLELIVLFGSCVNGKLKVTSDIDLLIITHEKIEQFIKGDIASMLDEPIESVTTDAIFYTIDEIRTGNSMFIQQVLKEGVVIWTKG